MKIFVRICCLIAGAVLAGCSFGGSTPPPACPEPGKTLSVILRPQENSEWCWAAAGEMAMDFLGTDVTQCDQANTRFFMVNCCNNPTPVACIQSGWPQFEKYGFSYNKTTNEALSWEQLKDQLSCKSKPVVFSWGWTGGGGHMQVATGYKVEGGIWYVYVNNPMPPNTGSVSYITYDAYVSGPGYTHWDDFCDIGK